MSAPEDLAVHFRIRHQVFVVEQGLFRSAGWDRDVHDDDPATVHAVGFFDGQACGTVRLYPVPEVAGRWKGDRLAVLDGHRHHGLGAPLVRFAVATAGARGGQQMEAYIQPANVTFFEWLGWRPAGGLVTYAGIPHQRMLIDLPGQPRAAPPVADGKLPISGHLTLEAARASARPRRASGCRW